MDEQLITLSVKGIG